MRDKYDDMLLLFYVDQTWEKWNPLMVKNEGEGCTAVDARIRMQATPI